MCKLSIITINYNNASGLRKTIESMVSQTYTDIEYIIIDGGSTDGSVEVIKEFTNILPGVYISSLSPSVSQSSTLSISQPLSLSVPYSPTQPIAYWISEPDTGIYNAMNKGILKATGEYCQFLNSGDILATHDVTERMINDLPDAGIVIGNVMKMLPRGKLLRDKGKGFEKPTFLTFYLGTLNHSPAYIRRSLFDKYGLYDESLKIVSDWKWYLQAVGLNNEQVYYRDIDVTIFDMEGISNSNHYLEKQERRKVLEVLVPSNILVDYDKYHVEIDQLKRLKRYPMLYWVFWFSERCLFKIEIWKAKIWDWK